MLARKVFASSAALSLSRFLGRGLDILAALVMARFLTPADFGVVTLGLAMLMVLESFTELPVTDALVREKELLQEDLDTAFTLTLLRGLLVAAILCASAFPMAWIYDDDRLVLLIFLLALAPLAKGVRSPAIVKYARNVDYRPLAIIDAVARSTSFVLAIAFAWYTESYMALVLLAVTPQIIEGIGTFLFAPYRPRFSLKKTRLIMSFAGMVTVSRVLATLSNEADRFIVGGVISKTALGFFSMGRSVATTASWSVAMPLISVMYPGLARIRHDMDRFRKSFLRGQAMIVVAIMPLAITLAVLAEPLVRLGLGEEWLSVVPVMQALALISAVATFSMPANSLAMAMGQPGQLIWREGVSLIVSIPAVTVGAIYYGLVGAVAGRVLAALAHTALSMEMIKRMAGISYWRQISNPWRSAVASIAYAAVLYAGSLYIPSQGWFEMSVGLLASGLVGIAVYAAVHVLMWKLAGSPEDGPEPFLFGIVGSLAGKLGFRRQYPA